MLWQDVIFGLRVLRKNPGFALVAVIALALGIGANATMFTIANGFLFRNLPFAGSQQILYIVSVSHADGREHGESYPDYRDIRSRVKSFQSLGAFSRFDVDVSDRVSVPAQYKGARLTANAFSVIGQRPILGRDFRPGDALVGAPPVTILSYALWRNRYSEQADILGSTIRINEVPTTVIGVMPRSLRFPGDSSLWVPLVPTGNWSKRDYRGMVLFGRLAPQATQASASAELGTVASGLASRYPGTDKGFGARVDSFNDYFIGRNMRLVLLALLGAVGFVLLIACANVVNLLLARAVLRGREISIRVALGAGRWRVIRQLLVESVILSMTGGVLGTVLGIVGVRIFQQTLLPDERAAYLSFPMDWRVLVYLAVITIGAGILAGLAPSFRLSHLDINASLKEGGRGAGAGRGGRRL
ncbi:MAG: ABC transporter permease, partial [Acidobacteriota bacterium]|nr:ABC transporter permease [Acidobacteriota bacterium]